MPRQVSFASRLGVPFQSSSSSSSSPSDPRSLFRRVPDKSSVRCGFFFALGAGAASDVACWETSSSSSSLPSNPIRSSDTSAIAPTTSGLSAESQLLPWQRRTHVSLRSSYTAILPVPLETDAGLFQRSARKLASVLDAFKLHITRRLPQLLALLPQPQPQPEETLPPCRVMLCCMEEPWSCALCPVA